VTNWKTGAGIAGATLSAIGPSQKVNTTDSNGNYTISGLAPGPYTITASANHYVEKSFYSFVYATENMPLNFELSLRSIRGRVYDASTPAVGIAEANVTIGENFVLTNASGHYEWVDLSGGTYTVMASAPGYSSQSQQVSVSTEVSTVANFGLSPLAPGRISGTVTDDATRKDFPQATVRVRRGSYEKLSTTNQNGNYAIENVPAWPYWTVEAYKVGYIAQSTLASVQPGLTTTQDFALIPFGIVSGTVKDQTTNQPIAGALVKVGSAFVNTTDSNGYYSIYAVAATYTVTASARGYATKSQSSVKVDEGKTTTVNFLLQPVPPGSIIGNVTDVKTGQAIVGAVVKADGYSNTTDANGNYILPNLPAGTYTVSASASGFVGDSMTLGVPSGGSIRVDFPLSPYTRVYLEPWLNFGNPGQTFTVDIDISEARFVYSWEAYLWWNPTLLDATNVVEGGFLKGPFGNRPTQFTFEEYPNEGVLYVKCLSNLPTPDNGVNGSGTLATLTFQIKVKGTCTIDITSALLFDPISFPIFPNAMEDAFFRTLQSDVNNDGVVNNYDLVAVRAAYGTKPGETNWNINADVNRDRIVSVFDLNKIGKDYGKSIYSS
jgi:hypothetical protein